MGIYAIGNLGSKIITFAMVPLYTFFVKDTGDFGYYDLCFTMILLLMSPFTLQLRDGAFRFVLETKDKTRHSQIVSFIYRTLLFNFVLFFVITIIFSLFTNINYLWYCFGLLVAMSFYEVIPQFARGLGKNQIFVASGIISSLGIGVFSIIFVVLLDMGIAGIFIANILARFVALIYIELRLQLLSDLFSLDIEIKEIGKDILKFSIPLIPSALCWWFTSFSDRWYINHFVGIEINGVYAIAARFTGIIQTLAVIFYQAWQETAILQYDSPDRDKFFSKIFNSYICLLAILLTAYAFLLKMFYPMIVDANYQGSVNYIYLMGISALLFALVYFFDMGYQCAKDTKRMLPSIMLATIVNLVCNYFLVMYFGEYGAILTTIITYLFLFAYRLHDMKHYFKLNFYPSTIIAALLIPLGVLPYHFIENFWLLFLYMIVACGVAFMSISKETRNEILNKILQKTRLKKQ